MGLQEASQFSTLLDALDFVSLFGILLCFAAPTLIITSVTYLIVSHVKNKNKKQPNKQGNTNKSKPRQSEDDIIVIKPSRKQRKINEMYDSDKLMLEKLGNIDNHQVNKTALSSLALEFDEHGKIKK